MNIIGRPLGAFLSKWEENSANILHNYGFINNGIVNTVYKGKNIKIIKYKTQHYDSDNENDKGMGCNDNDNDKFNVEYNNNTFHYLDFYLDENNILVNTDVYISQNPFEKNLIDHSINIKNIIDKECKICFKAYKNPIKLPCSHILCEQCINKIYISSTLENRCPFCREKL